MSQEPSRARFQGRIDVFGSALQGIAPVLGALSSGKCKAAPTRTCRATRTDVARPRSVPSHSRPSRSAAAKPSTGSVESDTAKIQASQVQVRLAGAHLYHQIHPHGVIEAHIPFALPVLDCS